VWGERDDVDLFYQGADLIIFPSIPLFNDKETSPLVIKEAISWKSPLLLRNLPVYVDMYQESEHLKFFASDSKDEIANQIRTILCSIPNEKTTNKKNMFIHRFTPSENKIDIVYIGDNDNLEFLHCDVRIKDIDTGATIYECPIGFTLGNSYMGDSYSYPHLRFPEQSQFRWIPYRV